MLGYFLFDSESCVGGVFDCEFIDVHMDGFDVYAAVMCELDWE